MPSASIPNHAFEDLLASATVRTTAGVLHPKIDHVEQHEADSAQHREERTELIREVKHRLACVVLMLENKVTEHNENESEHEYQGGPVRVMLLDAVKNGDHRN